MVTRRFVLMFFILALAGSRAALAAVPPTVHVLDFDGLVAALDSPQDKLLIDSRTEEPYAYGHLPGAVNLPGYVFDKDKIPGLPEDRRVTMIVYCAGGHCGIAGYVGERLLDLGYPRVFVYEEGVQGWLAHGQRLVNKTQEDSPKVTAADLGALLAAGANLRLVDARSPEEFARQTPPNARNLPPAAAMPGAPNLPPSLDEPLVVFGQSAWDGRPYFVADRLRELGYRKVRIYALGLNRWPPAGPPMPPKAPTGKVAP